MATGGDSGLLHRVVIDKLVAGGDGLGRLDDGRVVFVPGVVAGETVDIAVSAAKKDFVRAELAGVHIASSQRVVAPCAAALAGCGGCDWQHIEPESQLELKLAIAQDAFARTARMPDAPLARGRSVSDAGYRTTVRMVADRTGRLGFRARRTHEVVVPTTCHVAAPAVDDARRHLRVAPASEVTLRVGDDGVIAASSGERIRSTHHAAGDSTMRVSIGSFHQSGPQAVQILLDSVRALAGESLARPAIDAYGGAGLFTVGLGLRDGWLVESSASACADARNNTASFGTTVVESTFEAWPGQRADLVVADPARAGLGRRGVEAIERCQPRRVVLVSCDVVAAARDARLLADCGFRLVAAEVHDLFPHTSHLEVVAAFDAGDPSAIRPQINR
jgi:tRNA/tmRNA/rRNA uracil-C5-methylase (TrmA/RlmC/RlmD family)